MKEIGKRNEKNKETNESHFGSGEAIQESQMTLGKMPTKSVKNAL